MVLERAEIMIHEDKIDEFIEVLATKALPLASQYAGCISFKAFRGVEEPNNIMLLVEWVSVEAHLASRQEPAHAEFRSLLTPYAAGAKPTVHFAPL